LEQRAAAVRNVEIARKKLLDTCVDLKNIVSKEVDALLKDLPNAQDPGFETKYKTVRKKLQNLFPKTRNKSKQKSKTKKK
jgi:mRNA degradation ribonuclease J1/J2